MVLPYSLMMRSVAMFLYYKRNVNFRSLSCDSDESNSQMAQSRDPLVYFANILQYAVEGMLE